MIIIAFVGFLTRVSAASVLVVGVHEVGLLRWRLPCSIAGVEVNVSRVNDPLIVVIGVIALAHVHVNHNHVWPSSRLLFVLRPRVIISVVSARPSTSRRCRPL